MLSTPIAILAAVAQLMPGFIIVELSLAGSAEGAAQRCQLTQSAPATSREPSPHDLGTVRTAGADATFAEPA